MKIAISKETQALVDAAMETGKYRSPDAALQEAMKLLSNYDRKVAELRTSIQAAMARGGSHTLEEADASIEAELDAWESEKKAAKTKGVRAAE